MFTQLWTRILNHYIILLWSDKIFKFCVIAKHNNFVIIFVSVIKYFNLIS